MLTELLLIQLLKLNRGCVARLQRPLTGDSMPLSRKLFLSFAGIIVLILLQFIVLLRGAEDLNTAVARMDQELLPSVVAVQSMNMQLYSARSDLAALTTHTDKVTITEYHSRIKRTLRQMERQAAAYDALLAQRQGRVADATAKLWTNITEQLRLAEKPRLEVVRLASEGDTDGAIALFTRDRADFLRLARYFDQLVTADVAAGRAEAAQAHQDVRRLLRRAGALSLAVICVSLLVACAITISVQRQLGADPARLCRIAAQVADGAYTLEHRRPPHGVYAAIVRMVEALKTHIENARRESQRARQEALRAAAALEQAQQAVLLVGCGIRIRLCCVCGNGCSSHHADGRSSCAKLEKAAAGDLVFFHDVILSFHSIKHCGPASGPVFLLVGTLLL